MDDQMRDKFSDEKTSGRGNVTQCIASTFTDEEREAVETAASEAEAHQHTLRAAILRGLLERFATREDIDA